MKLYYSPGACSLADHIALHEAGMKFDLVKVDLKTHKLEDGRSFFDINPKGHVPALQFDDGEVLTENVAILSFIADQHPALDAGGELGRYRRLEMLAYLSSERSTKHFTPSSTRQRRMPRRRPRLIPLPRNSSSYRHSLRGTISSERMLPSPMRICSSCSCGQQRTSSPCQTC